MSPKLMTQEPMKNKSKALKSMTNRKLVSVKEHILDCLFKVPKNILTFLSLLCLVF